MSTKFGIGAKNGVTEITAWKMWNKFAGFLLYVTIKNY